MKKPPLIRSLYSTERCFNLFLYITNGVILELGARFHTLSGSDISKMQRLQCLAPDDLALARRFPVPARYQMLGGSAKSDGGALSYESFRVLSAQGLHLVMFEEVFGALRASGAPMLCITPVVDGTIPELTVSGMNGEGAQS